MRATVGCRSVMLFPAIKLRSEIWHLSPRKVGEKREGRVRTRPLRLAMGASNSSWSSSGGSNRAALAALAHWLACNWHFVRENTYTPPCDDSELRHVMYEDILVCYFRGF